MRMKRLNLTAAEHALEAERDSYRNLAENGVRAHKEAVAERNAAAARITKERDREHDLLLKERDPHYEGSLAYQLREALGAAEKAPAAAGYEKETWWFEP